MVWGEGGGQRHWETGVRLVFMAGYSLWITLPMEHKHKEVSLWPEVSLSLFFKNFVSREDVGAWLGGQKSDGLICNVPPCEENGKQWHRLSWQRWAGPSCCCWNFPFSGVTADTVMAGGAQNCVSGPQLVTVRCQVRLPGSSSALSPPCILLHREPESHWMGNSLYFSAPRPTKLPTPKLFFQGALFPKASLPSHPCRTLYSQLWLFSPLYSIVLSQLDLSHHNCSMLKCLAKKYKTKIPL